MLPAWRKIIDPKTDTIFIIKSSEICGRSNIEGQRHKKNCTKKSSIVGNTLYTTKTGECAVSFHFYETFGPRTRRYDLQLTDMCIQPEMVKFYSRGNSYS